MISRAIGNLGDLYTESGQTLQGSFSSVSTPIFASKYSLESSRRDLHNTLLCTAFQSQIFVKNFVEILRNFARFSLNFAEKFANLNEIFMKFRRNFSELRGAKHRRSSGGLPEVFRRFSGGFPRRYPVFSGKMLSTVRHFSPEL